MYAWAAPPPEHGIDALRAEDAYSSKLGYEEHIPGQTRDWNEELQTTRELPRRTLPQRLIRERAMFKVIIMMIVVMMIVMMMIMMIVTVCGGGGFFF